MKSYPRVMMDKYGELSVIDIVAAPGFFIANIERWDWTGFCLVGGKGFEHLLKQLEDLGPLDDDDFILERSIPVVQIYATPYNGTLNATAYNP